TIGKLIRVRPLTPRVIWRTGFCRRSSVRMNCKWMVRNVSQPSRQHYADDKADSEETENENFTRLCATVKNNCVDDLVMPSLCVTVPNSPEPSETQKASTEPFPEHFPDEHRSKSWFGAV